MGNRDNEERMKSYGLIDFIPTIGYTTYVIRTIKNRPENLKEVLKDVFETVTILSYHIVWMDLIFKSKTGISNIERIISSF